MPTQKRQVRSSSPPEPSPPPPKRQRPSQKNVPKQRAQPVRQKVAQANSKACEVDLRAQLAQSEKQNNKLRRGLKKAQNAPQPRQQTAIDGNYNDDGPSECESEEKDDSDDAFPSLAAPMPTVSLRPEGARSQERSLDNAMKRHARDHASRRAGSCSNNADHTKSPPPGSNHTNSNPSSPAPSTQLLSSMTSRGIKHSDQFIQGHSRGKVSGRDYASTEKPIIHHATKHYEARVIGLHPWPNTANAEKSIELAWTTANKEANEDINLNDRLRSLIRGKALHVRNELLGIARSHLVRMYGFDDDVTPRARRHNQRLYEALIEDDAFAYKSGDASKNDFAEHKVFSALLRVWGFSKSYKPAQDYAEYFSPVSVQTIAFLMGMVRFLLDEWKTGVHEKSSTGFTEVENKPTYTQYLKDVRRWNDLVPEVTLKIRQRMYNRAKPELEEASKSHRSLGKSKLAAMKEQLSQRTGDTDEEDMDMDTHDGVLTIADDNFKAPTTPPSPPRPQSDRNVNEDTYGQGDSALCDPADVDLENDLPYIRVEGLCVLARSGLPIYICPADGVNNQTGTAYFYTLGDGNGEGSVHEVAEDATGASLYSRKGRPWWDDNGDPQFD